MTDWSELWLDCANALKLYADAMTHKRWQDAETHAGDVAVLSQRMRHQALDAQADARFLGQLGVMPESTQTRSRS